MKERGKELKENSHLAGQGQSQECGTQCKSSILWQGLKYFNYHLLPHSEGRKLEWEAKPRLKVRYSIRDVDTPRGAFNC